MGAILKTFKATLPYNLIKPTANSKIEQDYNSRQEEEDMYRGDFGSSTFNKIYSLDDLKNLFNVKTKKIKPEKAEELAYDLLEDKPKYSMYSVITKEVGHAYYTLDCLNIPVVKEGYTVIKANSYESKDFKNITEMKKFLLTADPSWYNANIYSQSNKYYKSFGRVEFKDFKIYKTKPASHPKKYTHYSPMVEVVFGGWNPY